MKAILGTGARPNIVHADMIPPHWKNHLDQSRYPKITDASKNRIVILGTIRLFLRIRNLCVKAPFLVANNLAVTCLLGKYFVNRHGTAILPQREKINLKGSRAVAIINAKPGPDANLEEVKKLPSNTVSNNIRVSKSIVIPPMTQLEVLVNTERSGLLLIQSNPKLVHNNITLMANGVMDVSPRPGLLIQTRKGPEIPVCVWTSNFSGTPTTLSKGAVIGVALPAPSSVLHITADQLENRTPSQIIPTIQTKTSAIQSEVNIRTRRILAQNQQPTVKQAGKGVLIPLDVPKFGQNTARPIEMVTPQVLTIPDRTVMEQKTTLRATTLPVNSQDSYFDKRALPNGKDSDEVLVEMEKRIRSNRPHKMPAPLTELANLEETFVRHSTNPQEEATEVWTRKDNSDQSYGRRKTIAPLAELVKLSESTKPEQARSEMDKTTPW